MGLNGVPLRDMCNDVQEVTHEDFTAIVGDVDGIMAEVTIPPTCGPDERQKIVWEVAPKVIAAHLDLPLKLCGVVWHAYRPEVEVLAFMLSQELKR